VTGDVVAPHTPPPAPAAGAPARARACSLARYLSSDWLSAFWLSLGASTSIDLSVSSRRYALLSVKPVATCGYTCASTVACARRARRLVLGFLHAAGHVRGHLRLHRRLRPRPAVETSKLAFDDDNSFAALFCSEGRESWVRRGAGARQAASRGKRGAPSAWLAGRPLTTSCQSASKRTPHKQLVVALTAQPELVHAARSHTNADGRQECPDRLARRPLVGTGLNPPLRRGNARRCL